jgi:predicted small metal-binding protein
MEMLCNWDERMYIFSENELILGITFHISSEHAKFFVREDKKNLVHFMFIVHCVSYACRLVLFPFLLLKSMVR